MPVEETVVSIEKGDGSTHFDYQSVNDSLDAGSAFTMTESVLQSTSDGWSQDGYSCHPEPPYDNYFNIDMNYSECTHLLSPPSTETVSSGDYYYFPLGPEISCYPRFCNTRLNMRQSAFHRGGKLTRTYCMYKFGAPVSMITRLT